MNGIYNKVLLPFRAYQEKLRRNKLHQLIQFILGYLTSVRSDNAASCPRQPNFIALGVGFPFDTCTWIGSPSSSDQKYTIYPLTVNSLGNMYPPVLRISV